MRDFSYRPDIKELIEADYDNPVDQKANQTLIICSVQRTGSYELCRLLMAAGIGIPHEYFHPNYGQMIGTRWGLEDPLGQSLPAFVQRLKTTRSQNGVFCFKLQPQQFNTWLMNEVGQELVTGAKFIHLFRSDVVNQYKSFRRAKVSGRWDFGDKTAAQPDCNNIEQALKDLNTLVTADAKLRRLFVQLGVDPLFVTTSELFKSPQEVIQRIAASVGVDIDHNSLKKMLSFSTRYAYADDCEVVGTKGELFEYAFKK